MGSHGNPIVITESLVRPLVSLALAAIVGDCAMLDLSDVGDLGYKELWVLGHVAIIGGRGRWTAQGGLSRRSPTATKTNFNNPIPIALSQLLYPNNRAAKASKRCS